ncbi:PAS domain S-box protein [Candidatus Nitrospira bockiana]
MPKINGLAFLSRLRALLPDVPVLLMSGHLLDQDAAKAINGQAFAFLTKPIERDQLTAWVRRAIEMSQLRKVVAKGALVADWAESIERLVQDRTRTIQDQERFLAALIDTVPCLVVLTDPDGNILVFNTRAEELTGYQREEVVGRPVLSFVPPAWQAIVRQRFADPCASALKIPHRNPWLTKTGRERVIEWRCTSFLTTRYARPCILGIGLAVDD